MKHWSERLREALGKKGWSVAELIRRSKLPRDLIYKYHAGEVDNPRGDALKILADTPGITEMELRYGVAVSQVPKKIPLLNMLSLGKLAPGSDLLSLWDGESVVIVTGDVSQTAVGIVLIDDSCSPEFKAGDTIIFDPTAEPIPGRYVVAQVAGFSAGVFRKYRPSDPLDGQQFVLIAANPDYPPIQCDAQRPGRILGRAVKHQRDI